MKREIVCCVKKRKAVYIVYLYRMAIVKISKRKPLKQMSFKGFSYKIQMCLDSTRLDAVLLAVLSRSIGNYLEWGKNGKMNEFSLFYA